MKSILMSIRPEWYAKILNKEKIYEIRKLFPKDYVGWIYMYCCKNGGTLCLSYKPDNTMRYVVIKEKYDDVITNGHIVARFWCDKVEDYVYGHKWSWENGATMWGADNSYEKILKDTCLTDDELRTYTNELCFSAIHITKLEIFDKPRELCEFKPHSKYPTNRRITKAPQSWCYVEV